MLYINIPLQNLCPSIYTSQSTHCFFEMRFTRLETLSLRSFLQWLYYPSSMPQKPPDVLVSLTCLVITSHQAFPLENEQERINHSLLGLRHLVVFCFHSSMGILQSALDQDLCLKQRKVSDSCRKGYSQFIEQIDGIQGLTEGITQKASTQLWHTLRLSQNFRSRSQWPHLTTHPRGT